MTFSYNLLLISSNAVYAVELIQVKSILCSELLEIQSLAELRDRILFYLVIMLFAFAWILFALCWKLVFRAMTYVNLESPVSHKNVSHGTLIELIWTITPALILMFIAFPSFKLLYLMDEVSDPSMAVFAEGHQWYWSYQYPDFLNNYDEFFEDLLCNYHNELIETDRLFTMNISDILNSQDVEPSYSQNGATESAIRKLELQNYDPVAKRWNIYSSLHSQETTLIDRESKVLADIVRRTPNNLYRVNENSFPHPKIIGNKSSSVTATTPFIDFIKDNK